MTKVGSSVGDQLRAHARGLESYITRLERLHLDGRVYRIDLERAYAGAYLLFYTSLERSIEQLFLGILTQEFTFRQRGIRPLVAAPSERIARQIVTGERAYADWLPLRLTEGRAKALLAAGRPFESIVTADRRFLESMGYVRNALAHGSAHSLRRFRTEVIDGGPLPTPVPPGQRKPAPYLRGTHTTGQSRFSFHLAEASAIVRRLCQ
jgi:hypothetical protein